MLVCLPMEQEFPHLRTPYLATVRSKVARRRNLLYLRSEKLRALLASGPPKRILFSEKPDWVDDIRGGFRRLPHEVEFGAITEESFNRYDIVVPLTLSALEDARRYCPMDGNAFPLPSEESVRLCDDKYEFNQALIQSGFGRYIPSMTLGPGLKPPYILKKRIGGWGIDCFVIRSREDEAEQSHRIHDPEYFCQELVLGPTEYATHILFIDGRIVKALNIRYEFAGEAPIKGQDAALLKGVCRCPYLGLFARILGAIEFEGLCCVNYKVANGEPMLLEINPRFGGSLAPYFFSFVRHLQ